MEKIIELKYCRSVIGGLFYLTASWPNIPFAIGMCTKFQSYSKEFHLSAVKKILRYLKKTLNIGLWYLRTENFELIRFLDSAYVRCKLDRKVLVIINS